MFNRQARQRGYWWRIALTFLVLLAASFYGLDDNGGQKQPPASAASTQQIDFDHILGADYNKKGWPVGGHSLVRGDVRLVKGSESPADKNGVYLAQIMVPNPEQQGQWLKKRAARHSMFPKNWDEAKIKAEVSGAWNSPAKIIDPNTKRWKALSPSGIEIQGYTTPRITAYPIYQGTDP